MIWDKGWVPTNRDEMILLLGIMSLQDISRSLKLVTIFLKTDFWKHPFFYETMSEKSFCILQKFLHFADSEAYHGQVPLKIFK
jgi:hypothetical protein